MLLTLMTSPDPLSPAPPDAAAATAQLPTQVAALADGMPARTAAAIAAARARLTELAEAASALRQELVEAGVRTLEQTSHGSVARGVRAKAEHLGVVARGMELKSR
jgi:diphthamide biosynthesis protein 3